MVPSHFGKDSLRKNTKARLNPSAHRNAHRVSLAPRERFPSRKLPRRGPSERLRGLHVQRFPLAMQRMSLHRNDQAKTVPDRRASETPIATCVCKQNRAVDFLRPKCSGGEGTLSAGILNAELHVRVHRERLGTFPSVSQLRISFAENGQVVRDQVGGHLNPDRDVWAHREWCGTFPSLNPLRIPFAQNWQVVREPSRMSSSSPHTQREEL